MGGHPCAPRPPCTSVGPACNQGCACIRPSALGEATSSTVRGVGGEEWPSCHCPVQLSMEDWPREPGHHLALILEQDFQGWAVLSII